MDMDKISRLWDWSIQARETAASWLQNMNGGQLVNRQDNGKDNTAVSS